MLSQACENSLMVDMCWSTMMQIRIHLLQIIYKRFHVTAIFKVTVMAFLIISFVPGKSGAHYISP